MKIVFYVPIGRRMVRIPVTAKQPNKKPFYVSIETREKKPFTFRLKFDRKRGLSCTSI